ncbi:MAG: PLxRFG domain-containing protein [Syntrophaceae bacterium]|nr:PLxRFG domain-containing protein [Syntrophaceae bacterium]
MSFDILGYYNDHKVFYGNAPLEDVAKDAYKRGFHQGEPDYNTWRQKQGVASILDEDAKKRMQDNPSNPIGRAFHDTAMSLAKGVTVGIPETIVGLADIPTMGYAGKGVDALLRNTVGGGFQEANQFFEESLSPETQAAKEKMNQAKGFVETIKTGAENPSAVWSSIMESIPSMFGGAALGRKAMKGLGKAISAEGISGEEKIRRAVMGGAIGEGLVTAGQNTEQLRQQMEDGTLSPGQVAVMAGSGALTGLISRMSGGLAQRLKIPDIDTLLAGADTGVKMDSVKAVLKGIVGSAISEGALEELPQSAQEQMAQNIAIGKPMMEGVAEAAAQGLMAGMGMGVLGAGGSAIGHASEKSPKSYDEAVQKLQQAAMIRDVFEEGSKTGMFNGKPFTPDMAASLFQESIARGVYAEEDIDRFKQQYPMFSAAFNSLIADNIVAKVDEAVKSELVNEQRQRLLPPGQGFTIKGKDNSEGVTVGEPYGDVLQPVRGRNDDDIIDVDGNVILGLPGGPGPKLLPPPPGPGVLVGGPYDPDGGVPKTRLLPPGQGFELGKQNDDVAILQERIAKEKQILEERQKANPDKTYTKLAARIKEDENRLAEIIKGGRENGLQGKTETEIITETPPAPLSQTDATTVGSTDEAKSGGDESAVLSDQAKQNYYRSESKRLIKLNIEKIKKLPANKRAGTVAGDYYDSIKNHVNDLRKYGGVDEEAIALVKNSGLYDDEYIKSFIPEYNAAIKESMPFMSANPNDISGKPFNFKPEKHNGQEVVYQGEQTKDVSYGMKAILRNRKIVHGKLQEYANAEKAKDNAGTIKALTEAIDLAEKSNAVLAAYEAKYGAYRAPYNVKMMRDKVARVEAAAQSAGKKVVSAKEAAIQRYVKHHEDRGEKNVDRRAIAEGYIKAIEEGDVEKLRGIMNGINPEVNKLFTAITGLPAKTQKDADKSIRSLNPKRWDAWQRETAEKRKADAIRSDEEYKQEQLNGILNKQTRDSSGAVITMREFYDRAIKERFNIVTESKKGVASSYRLVKTETGQFYKVGKKLEAEYLKQRINELKSTEEKTEKKATPEPAQAEKPAATEYGANNKIFTKEKADKAREILRKKLNGTQLNMGLDPEIISAGIDLAGYHIEAGAKKFMDYARRMIDDIGDAVQPYLKSFYMAARNYPGIDKTGMNTEAELDEIDENAIDFIEKESKLESEGGEKNVADVESKRQDENDRAGIEGQSTQDLSGTEASGETQTVRGGSRRTDDGELRQQPVRDAHGSAENDAKDEEIRLADKRPEHNDVRSETMGGDAGDVSGVQRSRTGRDHVIEPGSIDRTGSWFNTAKTNIDIIELVKKLDEEGRLATPEEQALLAKYTGFGASELANRLFPGYANNREIYPHWESDKKWREQIERLVNLLTPEEIATAARSTQYAHYTSPAVINSIYKALDKFGFKGGKVLEPGMGVGSFFGLMPESMRNTSIYTGIEFDAITAKIAKHLYQNQNIIAADFTKQKLPNGFFDLAIGNPPFSSTKILTDPDYKKLRLSLHDYFFVKSLDKVRPGGLLVFITSRYTMDKQDDRVRQILNEKADLLGAIRLPQTAFKQNAGTEVVTDVILLRKKAPGETSNGMDWKNTSPVTTENGEFPVNEYYVQHPEMVLGKHSGQGSMYKANEYTVMPLEGDIEQAFAKAVDTLPENVYSIVKASTEDQKKIVIEQDFNPANKKEGGAYLSDKGHVMITEQGRGVPIQTVFPKITPDETKWMKDYVGLRGALKTAQYDQLNDGQWEKSLEALQKTYKEFVKKYGRIREYKPIERKTIDEDGNEQIIEDRKYKYERAFKYDVESPLVIALEDISDTGVISEAPSLKGRTILKPTVPEITSVPDALAVSLNDIGHLDLDHIASLMGQTKSEIIEQLGDLIYETPDKEGNYILADEYLSGNVVDKLAIAKEAAKVDEKFQRNVEALQKAQPEPLASHQITVNPGVSWIPLRYYNNFIHEVLGLHHQEVHYNPSGNIWTITGGSRQGQRGSASEWGTSERGANEIFDAVLNNSTLRINKTVVDELGNQKSVLDPAETAAANDIAKKMRNRFKTWVWEDAGRTNNLLEIYNSTKNTIVPRKFDGKHLTLPGVSLRFALRPHQKNAIWRIIQDGNTYIYHAVGAGKTYEMVAAGMEQRRLGLIKKPLYVVPKHMLRQFSNEFQELYPMAHIMVADEENFHTTNRKRFMAQAALNNPDAIVITHPAFGLLKMKEENIRPVKERVIHELQEALADLEDDKSVNRIKIKQMEKRIEQVEQRFDSMIAGGDNVLTFEDMGVDFLFVDEAHQFRKLDFTTNRQAKGIDANGSRRAMDLYIKSKWLSSVYNGRSHVFASGTPVTNTMGELYTVMKFFMEEEMDSEGIHYFDSWANEYGEMATAPEMNAAGRYEMVERFAKFVNMPELMSRVRTFMDVLTNSQLGAFVNRPKIIGGNPNIVVTPKLQSLKDYQDDVLLPRIEESKKWKPSPGQPGNPDPMINIITDGRLASIDLRFVMRNAPNDPNSKLNQYIDKIISLYNESKDNVYLDGEKESPIKGGAIIAFYNHGFGANVARNRGFDARAWMMSQFKKAGIKASDVAWIDDYDTAAKKEAMFKEMRNGQKRILLGSAKKMGTGMNVQTRLANLVYLDPPWYPSDVEQPLGRIIRQGNQNKEVGVYYFATKGSYDSTMWQMVQRKASFQEDAFSGAGTRSMEDISETSLYEMAAALASGDERAIRLAGLSADIDNLENLRVAHHHSQNNLKKEKNNIEYWIPKLRENIASLKEADDKVSYIGRTIDAKSGDRSFTERKDFGAVLIDKMLGLINADEEAIVQIGSISGFPIVAKLVRGADRIGFEDGKRISIPGEISNWINVEITDKVKYHAASDIFSGTDPVGLVTKIINKINGVSADLRKAQDELNENENELKKINARIGAPFEFAQELNDKITEAAQIKRSLEEEANATDQPSKNEPVQIDTADLDDLARQRKKDIAALDNYDDFNDVAQSMFRKKYNDLTESQQLKVEDSMTLLLASISKAEAILSQHGKGSLDKAQERLNTAVERWSDWHEGEEYPYEIKLAQHIITSLRNRQERMFDGQQYSIERSEGKAAMPTLPEVQSVFKGQEVTQLADGSFAIKTAGGANLVIKSVDHVSPNKAVLKISYGMGKLEGGDVVAGAYQKGTIQLVRDAANKWTLHHESVHWMEDVGILTKSEINLLKNHIKNLVDQGKFETVNQEDVGGEEDRANFLADALTKEPKGLLGRIVNKIHDFIDKLVNAFGIRTVRGIQRDVQSGKVFEREGNLTEQGESANRYAVTKDKGTANIPAQDIPVAEGGKITTEEARIFLSGNPVASITGNEFAKSERHLTDTVAEWYVEHYGGKATNPIIGDVVLDKRGIKDSIGHGLGHVKAAAFALVPDIISQGKIINYNSNWQNRNIEGYVIAAPVSIGNNHHIGVVIVRKSHELQRFYLHEIYLTSKLQEPFKTGAFPLHEGRKPGGPGVITNLLLDIFNVKSESPKPSRSRDGGEQDDDIRYSIRKQQAPPDSSDPKVLNSYLKDEADAIFQTIYNKLHPKKMTWLETMLKSPEWFGHTEVGRIVKIFMRDRSELYHEYFNDLNMADDIDAPENTVTEAAKALKNKGLSLAERMEGKVSPEYQKLTEFLDYFDTKARRDQNKTDEENLKSCEDYMRRNGATDEVVRVWRLYRDSYDKALVMMTQQLRDLIDDLREQAALRGEEFNLDEMKETLQFALAQMEMWKGYYAPRQREQGNWKVQAYKEHGPLEANREYYREHRPSELSAQRLAKKLKREGWKVYSIGEIEKLPETVYQDVKSVAAAKLIDSALEKVKDKGTGIAAMNSEILQAVADEIRARGFRSTMIHRTEGAVIKGYIEDPIKRHLLYINNVSGGMSKAKVARMAMSVLLGEKVMGQQVGGIDPKKDPEAYKVAVNYIEEQLRNLDATDRAIGLAKSIATFKFLGFNLRSAFVNLTSLLTTAPVAIHQYALGGRGSLMGIMKELASAGKDYGSYMAGRKLNAEEMSFLNEMHAKGWDDPQYTRDAMGTIAKVHSQAWSTVMDYAMYMFGQTEKFNRGATILAAYRLARKQGIHIETAKDMAKEASDRAHGVYGRATMPMWAQGTNPAAKIGQMMYVYSKFSHNYLQMLYDMGWKKRNLKGFAFATLAPVVLAGGAAIPFKGALFGMMGIILSALGYDRDPEKFVWDTIREHLGSEAEKVGRHGLTGAMGVDVSGSLSIGVGVPKDFIDLTGAVGGAAESIGQVKEGIANRQPMKALEAVLPTGLASPVRAYREAKEGVSTKNNRPVWDESGRPLVPEASEAAQRALGFRSTRQAVLSERNWEGRREIERFEEKRNEIYKKYRAWVLSDRDREDYKKIVSDVQEFNRNITPMRGKVARITSQSLRDQSRRMARPTKRELAILAD